MRVYAGKGVEQDKHSSIADGCANLYGYSGNHNGNFSQNWESIYLKTQLYQSLAYIQRMLTYTVWILTQLYS